MAKPDNSKYALISYGVKKAIYEVLCHDKDKLVKFCIFYFIGGYAFIMWQVLSDEEREAFFEKILPKMVELALQLPTVCTGVSDLLKYSVFLAFTLYM